MTRKDYVLIAEALASARPLDGATAASVHWQACHAMCDALAADNPRFDRERFLKAAGVQS